MSTKFWEPVEGTDQNVYLSKVSQLAQTCLPAFTSVMIDTTKSCSPPTCTLESLGVYTSSQEDRE